MRDLRCWAPPVVLAVTVVAFASGSSSIPAVTEVGRTLRWVWLFVLLGVAGHYAATRDRSRPWPRGFAVFASLAAAFLLFALASAFWSVDPGLTFARAVSLSVLFAAGAGLALGASGDRAEIARLLYGVLAGAVVVAALGLVLLVASGYAAQAATPTTPWRFRGFGENPNTVPMLLAVTAPIALWVLLEPGTRHRRAAGAALALFLPTVVAAQSRGGLLAILVGASVVALALMRSSLWRIILVAALALVFAGGALIREVLPDSSAPFISEFEQVTVPPGPVDESARTGEAPSAEGAPAPESAPAELPLYQRDLPRREDEIGSPLFTTTAPSTRWSGRAEAWLGALELAAERPIVGYGFGTEAKVFVDRWTYFQGANPENAFIGLLLQLGVVGMALFVVIGSLLLVAGTRVVAREPWQERGVPAACLGMLAAGAVLMVTQSYIYSVGNIASVSVWTAAFLLASVAFRWPVREPARAAPHPKASVDARAD